ncbi:VOC family protein [Stackebrandtia nassauensis]|uniref:Uncharacterized protein n=1 Tax=Stackebrandtia nassauensis (strain DSM 44728 / CIP 108903 / NRRL B-16338 / NBRC 102104 / LLR-40K-21) TaxID=446470 RepID=D3QBK2_STANL|nr:VOC family protein [Stackebrandtia nassauensis]ADD42884.1 hypothetical protein Snas_3214 [Stackebrandtia nassauensis DSM 44728]
MTTIDAIILETPDPAAAEAFYAAAFDLKDRVRASASQAPTSGFRGYTMSLVVGQPSTVDSLVATALAAGATTLKPAKKSFWGYGAVVQDPFGTIWKIASSSKKNTEPDTRRIDEIVLLLGVSDVAVTKQFYADQGLSVAKSYGRKYVEFATANIKLALYGRRFAAKDAGVPIDGSGSHRLVIDSDAGTFTDPDGFAWNTAVATN